MAEHIDALRAEGPRLVAAVDAAGPDAPVPTCPGWVVRDLAWHLGGVHRWATGVITGGLAEPWNAELDQVVGQWPDDADLSAWLAGGLAALVDTLASAAPDVDCWTFLAAPSPLAMWARRQVHETVVHRVDAQLAAATAGGRAAGLVPVPVPVPVPVAVAVDPGLAADGVDELLCGFVARRSGRLQEDPPASLAAACTDVDRGWLLGMSSTEVRTTAGGVDAASGADCRVRGSAADLYLTLWNRGLAVVGDRAPAAGVSVDGDRAVLDRFSDRMQVTWS